MSNQLLAPPEIDPDNLKDFNPPPLWSNNEADGSFWRSLAGNLRDALSRTRKPPLRLESRPVPVENPFRVEPIWIGIRDGFRETFFPGKTPPLQLESRAIPVADPLARPRGRRSDLISIAIHLAIVAAIAAYLLWPRKPVKVAKQPPHKAFNVTPFMPMRASSAETGGGGGGGDRDILHARVGKLPKIAKTQFVPPEEIIRNSKPKLTVEPTVVMPKNIRLPNQTMPNLGNPLTAVKGPASNGTGAGGGIGSGKSGGVASGTGAGVGPGQSGGFGGKVYQVGGGVSPPKLISKVTAEFSDQARRANYQGEVTLLIVVDTHGVPHVLRIIRHLGMGLDQKAIEAVKQDRFKPAMLHGHPVPVKVNMTVDFHLY